MSNALIDNLKQTISSGNIKRDFVDRFGESERNESIQISEMIRGNLSNLEGRDKPVFDALNALRNTVNDISPHNYKPSFFERLFGKNSSMKKFFERFDDNKDLLNDILKKLEDGKQTLLRDNVALEIEAQRNLELAQKLQVQLELANEANVYVESIINAQDSNSNAPAPLLAPPPSDDNAKEVVNAVITMDGLEITPQNKEQIQNQILFPLKQKIMDLQQQILVHTQGEIALKTLINNNKELANSVDRTKSVTLNALNVAIITAQGLDQQQRVLKAVQDINAQTSDLIAHTASKLKEQGAQIQEGAANAMLDMDKLKSAFDNVIEAMNDVNNFKLNSLPKMQENINTYSKYLDEMKERRQKVM